MEFFLDNDYSSFSLSELYRINDVEEQKYALEFYKNELLSLGTDRFTKKLIKDNWGQSIEKIITKLEESFLENRSVYTFPDNIVLFYPTIREQRASSNIICDVTGAEIKRGSFYCSYRPMLENISNNHVYVLSRTLRSETAEIDFFPTSIYEFDILSERIDNAYFSLDEGYDYYGISRRIGGRLALRRIR